MTQYNTVKNSIKGTMPSWAGLGSADGSCTAINYPKSVWSDTDATGYVRDYTPHQVFRFKNKPNYGTVHWKEALRTRWPTMSPYNVGETVVDDYLVYRPLLKNPKYRLCKAIHFHWIGYACQTLCREKDLQSCVTSYEQGGDLQYWLGQGLQVYDLAEVNTTDISNARQDTQLSVAADSYKSYDALTDILQLKQTVDEFHGILGGVSKLYKRFINKFPLADIQTCSRWLPTHIVRSTSRALRAVGNAWLAYQYAYRPLLYSYNDIKKSIDRRELVIDKKTKMIYPRPLNPSLPTNYISKSVTGSVRVTSTVACAYSSASVSKFAGVTVNPFITAWELIPYSFVLDWFIDIGDWVTVNFSADLSELSAACSAVRTQIIETYNLHLQYDTHCTAEAIGGTTLEPCWPSGSYTTPTFGESGIIEGPLRVVRYNHYDRTLFNRETVSPRLYPSLSWRRYVSGAALSHNYLNQLKSIKKLLN